MKTKIISILFTATLLGGSMIANAANNPNVNDLKKRTMFLERQVKALQTQIDTIKTGNKSNYDLDLLVEMYAHGPAIVTSPALGVRRSAEDAKDLMVNLPSVNEDLVLLKLRQKMDNYALENNIPIPQRPIISMSGGVEGKINNKRINGQADRADINFSRAELDVIGEAGPWATAAMIIAYEDADAVTGTRVSNSRLKLDRGFLTIGQLNKFPAYFTVGQVFAPFGKYSSYMLTDPSTKLLGRQKDRMLVLGFDKWGITAQAYGFPGETKVVDSNNFFHHAGFNLDYEYSQDKFKLNVGGSIMGNFAETDGMQNNIFANDSNAEKVQSAVKGIDGRVRASYDMFTVLAEYVGVMDRFNSNDLYFNMDGLNQKGAKPQAFNVEGAVEFTIKGKPNNFAVGYGRTWEALALQLPKHTFFGEYNVSLLKNTILSFEYRHDIGYAQGDVGGRNTGSIIETGKDSHANIVTVQLGIYF